MTVHADTLVCGGDGCCATEVVTEDTIRMTDVEVHKERIRVVALAKKK